MNEPLIYLDNNATTQVAPEVFTSMQDFFCTRYGNPSSIHRFGGEVADAIEQARCHVAELLGANFRDRDGIATEIIFTSCGTEGDNSAINAGLKARPGRKKIITTAVEHPAILSCVKEWERQGYKVEYVPVDTCGRLDIAALTRVVDDDTAIVSAMAANNETGTLFPISEIAKIAHAHGALCHTDAVQAAGKISVDVEKWGVDFLTISGHKLHAPKGIGALYVRRGIRFSPLIFGGHQERLRRGGTENVPSIVGLGVACKMAKSALIAEQKMLSKIRDDFENQLLSTIPKIQINGDLDNRLPNTSSISFEGIEGESILMLLDVHRVCASSGSACTTGSLEPSHVLRAMNIPYTCAHGTIRFSLSRYNNSDELTQVARLLPPIINRLRKISPFWSEQ